MVPKKKFDDFDNFQKARQKSFRSFIKKYKLTKDPNESLEKALETAKINRNILNLTPKYYKGLQGEIIFLGKKYESLNLDPLLEIGDVPADFRSQVTDQYYDVTTNLDYKDIEEYIRNDSKECMIAFVDIKSEDIELIPTVFPECPECGNPLHYIYSMDPYGTGSQLGIDYPSQDLYKYCEYCDEPEIVNSSYYYIFDPNQYLDSYEDKNTPEAKELLRKKWTEIANLARKEFDVFISCVTRPEIEMGKDKDDLYEANKPKWIHPILDLDRNPNRKIYFSNHSIISY